MNRPCVGLVLSGGGARGAYEVGVLRYVRERLKIATPFDVITGTSVGAVNGAYIAATCDRPKAQARVLQKVWSELTIDRVYKVGWRQVRALPTTLFGKVLPKTPHGAGAGGLVDGRVMQDLVRNQIPWPSLTRNLHDGHLRAFAATATEVATGLSTVFVQSSKRAPMRWSPGPNEVIVQTSINAEHVLSSAAIPTLFAAIKVGGQFFVDGALRQNTPLRPAMRLGANRLLVIGLRRPEPPAVVRSRQRESVQYTYPNVFFLLGKMLDALMLDKVDADLQRIDRMNEIIEAGEAEYGDDFGERLSSRMDREHPYRKTETLLIQPSEDIGEIAAAEVRRTGLSQYSGIAARWVRRSLEAEQNADGGSDLASYVLFDPAYIRQLIDLGYADAERHHDALCELWRR